MAFLPQGLAADNTKVVADEKDVSRLILLDRKMITQCFTTWQPAMVSSERLADLKKDEPCCSSHARCRSKTSTTPTCCDGLPVVAGRKLQEGRPRMMAVALLLVHV